MTDAAAQPAVDATSPPLADEVIRTVDLTKVYPGDVKAVDRLNLTVHRGEIFGLLGPNGAGKTTTAGMLTTRVVPTSGRAFVGGVDVWAHPAKAKRLIGVVPQTNTLDRCAERPGQPLLPRSVLRHELDAVPVPRPTTCWNASSSPSGRPCRSGPSRAAWPSG